MRAPLPFNQKVVIDTEQRRYDRDKLTLNDIERAFLVGYEAGFIVDEMTEHFVIEATGITRDGITTSQSSTRFKAHAILGSLVTSLVYDVGDYLSHVPWSEGKTRQGFRDRIGSIYRTAGIISQLVCDDPYDQMVDEQISLEAAD